MNVAHNNREIADRFGLVARRFCAVVDSASGVDRTELLMEIYRTLPSLIDEAVRLPEVELSEKHDELAKKVKPLTVREQQWTQLYNMLKEKLGDWDLYRHVFDPTKDPEAIFGTLADDLADIYRDLKDGLILDETLQAPPEDSIWTWPAIVSLSLGTARDWRVGDDSHPAVGHDAIAAVLFFPGTGA